MHELVHEPHLVCLLRTHVAAREDHVEPELQADQSRQALRAAGARHQAELDFGQGQHGLRVIGGDAIATRQRRLQPAAKARAVNRGHDRYLQRLEAGEQLLAAATQRLRVCGALQGEKFIDVGTREPRIALAADENDALDRTIALDLCEERGKFSAQASGHLVHGFARQVDRHDGEAVQVLQREGWHHVLSMTMA